MKTKALIVGGLASFEGPWVHLEEGEWLVEPSPDFHLHVYESTKVHVQPDGGFELTGPIRIRAIVVDNYKGEGVFLQARKVA
jgi:hypothetical protein